jgi:hypothetical protein
MTMPLRDAAEIMAAQGYPLDVAEEALASGRIVATPTHLFRLVAADPGDGGVFCGSEGAPARQQVRTGT